MKRKILITTKCFLLFFLTLSLTNCATILSKQYQDVNIKSGKKDAKIYVDGDKVGEGEIVKSKLLKDGKVKQIRIEREGFKDFYTIHKQSSKHPLYILSCIPGGALAFIPPLLDTGPKSFIYDKSLRISQDFYVEKKFRNDDEVFLKISKVKLSLPNDLFKVNEFTEKNYLKAKRGTIKESNIRQGKAGFDFYVFYDIVEKLLRIHNFKTKNKDETQNSLKISSEIIDLEINSIEQQNKWKHRYFTTDLVINWSILNEKDEILYSNRFTIKSDEFTDDYWNNATKKSIEDAITKSFYHFLSLEKAREVLKK
ncbi:hypothetical protein [Aureivirga marina]|uniref:hypothetical protein n=1 Tax=Aureivirga marina TaxID=1182451 RepID=UPI0018CBA475|nr:hypothetical protein [Aureivirga marina]